MWFVKRCTLTIFIVCLSCNEHLLIFLCEREGGSNLFLSWCENNKFVHFLLMKRLLIAFSNDFQVLYSALEQRFVIPRRLLMTGTPIQNNLSELWALMHFCMPSVFGTLEQFVSTFNEAGVLSAGWLQIPVGFTISPWLNSWTNKILFDLWHSYPHARGHFFFATSLLVENYCPI